MSITSSSSFFGASLSLVSESTSSLALGYTSDSSPPQTKQKFICGDEPLSFSEDSAAELAHRVRQSAGVLLAVPKDAQIQGLSVNKQLAALSSMTYLSFFDVRYLLSYSHRSFPKASHSPRLTTSLNQSLQSFLFFIRSVNPSSINPTHIFLPSSQSLYQS